MKQILAIATLTLRAAFRYRIVLVLAGLLLASVVVLPLIIKDDGTARGFTQIILTYTLSLTTAFLGFATLWLSCGILAREIEEAQMQMVVVKPVGRWQIWLGKWLGILALNALLLALTGAAVYGLMLYRASKLPPTEKAILRNEIFVARNSAREELSDYSGAAQKILRDRLKSAPLPEGLSVTTMRRMIEEQLKSRDQLIPPGYRKQWEIPIGDPANVRQKPMSLRVKVDPTTPGVAETFETHWEFGDPNERTLYETNLLLAAETFTEFPIPAAAVNSKGVLMIRVDNFNQRPLVIPVVDGMEVLYRVGGFGGNFARGLVVIFCWLSLLAALGLTGATFLSFPVAAFCTLAILFACFSSGTLKQIVDEGGITAIDPNTGYAEEPKLINLVSVKLAQSLLGLFNLARGFSPVDSLSSGRAITYGEMGRAIFQIMVLLAGFLGVIGILIFNKRELATAQK